MYNLCLIKYNAMKTYGGGGSIVAPHILNLVTKWKRVIRIHVLAVLSLWISTAVPIG